MPGSLCGQLIVGPRPYLTCSIHAVRDLLTAFSLSSKHCRRIARKTSKDNKLVSRILLFWNTLIILEQK